MYWSVVGAFVAFEYVAEWLISWCARVQLKSIPVSDVLTITTTRPPTSFIEP